MSTEAISSARGLLQDADRELARLEVQLEKVQAEIDAADQGRAARAAELAEHSHALANADAAHKATLAAREREIANRENALTVREREVAGEWARVSAKEHAVNNRALDLNNRIRGVA
jgi:hypothetical protein